MNPKFKEGPPTLRDLKAKSQNLLDQFVALCNRVTQEGPEIQKVIFDDPMVSERAGATGELGAMLSRLTDEALELDEKRRVAEKGVVRRARNLSKLMTGQHIKELDESLARLDALTPATQEKEEA